MCTQRSSTCRQQDNTYSRKPHYYLYWNQPTGTIYRYGAKSGNELLCRLSGRTKLLCRGQKGFHRLLVLDNYSFTDQTNRPVILDKNLARNTLVKFVFWVVWDGPSNLSWRLQLWKACAHFRGAVEPTITPKHDLNGR